MVIDEKTEGLFIYFNLLKQKKGKKPMRQSEKTKWQSQVQTYCHTE